MIKWNAGLVQHFEWPHLLGYHLNVVASAMTPEAEVARVYPSSPECVWLGDPGVPSTLHIYDEEGFYESIPNPDEPVPFSTVFLLFVDEDEAKSALPGLWSDPEEF